MNFLKSNECLLWTLSHVKPAKVYISFQVVALVYTCISLRYLKKCLWLKILSNKIIQVYNHHCKTIIMSGIDIILIFFWKMNKWIRWISGFINSGLFDYELPLKYCSLKIGPFSEIHTTNLIIECFFNFYILCWSHLYIVSKIYSYFKVLLG